MEAHVRIGLDELTPTQRRVLGMVADGRTNGEIARVLGISLDGAKWHVREILSKLNVDTREEAADIWREERGLRRRMWRPVAGHVLSAGVFIQRLLGSTKTVIATGTMLAVIAAATVAIVMFSLADGGSPAPAASPAPQTKTVATEVKPSSATPIIVPTVATTTLRPGETPAPQPDVDIPTLHEYPRGATVPDQYGILLFDTETGGAKVWDFPHYATIARPSPSGRYIVWQEIPRSSCDDCTITTPQASLLDTLDGRDIALSVAGAPAVDAAVLKDEKHIVVVSEGGIAILSLPGLAEEQHVDAGGTPGLVTFRYSADGKTLAISWASDLTSAAQGTMIVSGDSVTRAPIAGAAGWSHSGRRVAIANATQSVILDVDTGKTLSLARGGDSPSWSPDDRYVALGTPGELRGIAAFDAASGQELLRIYGPLGCQTSWTTTAATGLMLPGSNENIAKAGVRVPSGAFVPADPNATPTPSPTTGTRLEYDMDGTIRLMKDGQARASVIAGGRGMPFDWTREWPDGPSSTAVFLGLPGSDAGACNFSVPDVTVVLPPFDAANIPTPTPTRTH